MNYPERNERQVEVLAIITREILAISQTLKREEYAPRADADAMDDCISGCRNRITNLRRIRNELENLFTGANV